MLSRESRHEPAAGAQIDRQRVAALPRRVLDLHRRRIILLIANEQRAVRSVAEERQRHAERLRARAVHHRQEPHVTLAPGGTARMCAARRLTERSELRLYPVALSQHSYNFEEAPYCGADCLVASDVTNGGAYHDHRWLDIE